METVFFWLALCLVNIWAAVGLHLARAWGLALGCLICALASTPPRGVPLPPTFFDVLANVTFFLVTAWYGFTGYIGITRSRSEAEQKPAVHDEGGTLSL